MLRVLRARSAAFLVVLCAWASVATAQDQAESNARHLEQRLHAPCCRQQLLDGHESDIARNLRQEIRTRLRAGETPGAIETELIERYGASIVSIPADRDPRGGLSTLLTITMAIAALGLVLLGVRWVRRSRGGLEPPVALAGPGPATELDAKLDDELRRFEA